MQNKAQAKAEAYRRRWAPPVQSKIFIRICPTILTRSPERACQTSEGSENKPFLAVN